MVDKKAKLRAESKAPAFTNKSIFLVCGIVFTFYGLLTLLTGSITFGNINGMSASENMALWIALVVIPIAIGLYCLYKFKQYSDAEKD